MLLHHPVPLVGIALLEGQPFRIRAVGEQDRMASLAVRAKNVRAKHNAVIHPNAGVPFDYHAAGPVDAPGPLRRIAHIRCPRPSTRPLQLRTSVSSTAVT